MEANNVHLNNFKSNQYFKHMYFINRFSLRKMTSGNQGGFKVIYDIYGMYIRLILVLDTLFYLCSVRKCQMWFILSHPRNKWIASSYFNHFPSNQNSLMEYKTQCNFRMKSFNVAVLVHRNRIKSISFPYSHYSKTQ